ncbi:hypothetical protein DRN73_03520 [Candidatus Pacearchaeota archaeon]|nr:MAG: hypothetical protein DRN73_03520 [Candidatus Pacearchaeota archaeon]
MSKYSNLNLFLNFLIFSSIFKIFYILTYLNNILKINFNIFHKNLQLIYYKIPKIILLFKNFFLY